MMHVYEGGDVGGRLSPTGISGPACCPVHACLSVSLGGCCCYCGCYSLTLSSSCSHSSVCDHGKELGTASTRIYMPCDQNDLQLAHKEFSVRFDLVWATLRSGGNVNGSPQQRIPPIVVATAANSTGMFDVLLERGADP